MCRLSSSLNNAGLYKRLSARGKGLAIWTMQGRFDELRHLARIVDIARTRDRKMVAPEIHNGFDQECAHLGLNLLIPIRPMDYPG